MKGPFEHQILSSAHAASIACAGASGTVYTQSFKLMYGVNFALQVKATSDGNVNLAISLEESNTLPATEGSSDSNFVVPESASALITLTDENVHILTMSPVVAKYGRLRIVKGTGNDATTVLAAKLLKTEE